MSLSLRLDLRQSQSLVMTPQLQQAIKLLQLPNLELAAYVAQELEQNPFRLVTTTRAVQSKSELLTNHHRARERLRHHLRQPHHLVPGTDGTI